MSVLGDALDSDGTDEESILKSVRSLEHDFFIIIHSLDVLITNNLKCKLFIYRLFVASKERVHIIATIDHINSGLLFNSQESQRLNLFWQQATTYQTYTFERAYSCSFSTKTNYMLNSSSFAQNLTLSSIQHVHDSLTPNARSIFLLILNYYLEMDKQATDNQTNNDHDQPRMDREPEGLSFAHFYRQCREEFLVNSELTLRAQLTEFKDHKLIRLQKRGDGTEIIELLIDIQLAHKFTMKNEAMS